MHVEQSGGVIAGAVIGTLFALAAVAGIAFVVLRHMQQNSENGG